MLINKVCKECKLTKKSIEYYVDQGLICPQILVNGYRDFSASEIEQLKKLLYCVNWDYLFRILKGFWMIKTT